MTDPPEEVLARFKEMRPYRASLIYLNADDNTCDEFIIQLAEDAKSRYKRLGVFDHVDEAVSAIANYRHSKLLNGWLKPDTNPPVEANGLSANGTPYTGQEFDPQATPLHDLSFKIPEFAQEDPSRWDKLGDKLKIDVPPEDTLGDDRQLAEYEERATLARDLASKYDDSIATILQEMAKAKNVLAMLRELRAPGTEDSLLCPEQVDSLSGLSGNKAGSLDGVREELARLNGIIESM